MGSRRIARALAASGRFLFLVLATGACQTAGANPAGGGRPHPGTGPGVAVQPPARPDTTGAADSTRAPAPAQAIDIRLGSVLPLTGSPAYRDYAALIAEGVEVAAATYLGPTAQVTVLSRDDAGDPATAADQARDLESAGAIGAVGFLEQADLAAAAAGRMGALPLVSPTARVADGTGVYSLSGADPQAASEIATYAAGAGVKRVAIVDSRAPESSREADAFTQALQGQGVPVVGRFEYDVGATTFGDQLKAAQEALRGDDIRAAQALLGPDDTLHLNVDSLDKVAVFIPAPPEDVELIAPQVTFFGLDTLGIQVLGTSGWTNPSVLQDVPNRHTDGVVATMPVDGGPGSDGYALFKAAYEAHFQRSLVSPVPALGYDAALLLLEAAKQGARTPADLEAALEQVRGLQGATGILSVQGGQVFRRTEVVRIEHGSFVPVVY